MSVVSWGKPRVLVADLDVESPVWEEMPTPVESSTSLETTKGDKKEAKIEGGEYEDVKYLANTYAINLNIRAIKGRKRPISDKDGVVAHNYAIAVQPEDPSCPGLCFRKSAVSVEDTFTADDGGVWAYTFDALKKNSSVGQREWGVIEVTETDGSITAVKCTPDDGTAFDILKD